VSQGIFGEEAQTRMPSIAEIMSAAGQVLNLIAELNLVALQVRSGNRDTALHSVDRIISEFVSGGEKGFLFLEMSRAGLASPLLANLQELHRLLTTGASDESVLAKIAGVKEFLQEVKRTLRSC